MHDKIEGTFQSYKKMGFQPIQHYYLERNKEYKIGESYRGIYTGITIMVYYPETNYEEYLKFDNVRTLQNVPVSRYLFDTNETFSYFFSEKKYKCMEYRALHFVLRKITGDDTFLWF
jgi:hypothetical protein